MENENTELRKKASRLTLIVVTVLAVLVAADIVYMLVTKNTNLFLFQILLAAFIVGYMVMTDIVEPLICGAFKNMTDTRRNGFLKMLLMDLIGSAALLYWIVGIGSDEGADILIPLVIYVLTVQFKRKFRDEMEGKEKQEAEEAKAEEEQRPEEIGTEDEPEIEGEEAPETEAEEAREAEAEEEPETEAEEALETEDEEEPADEALEESKEDE